MATSDLSYIFRCDASSRIGGGHVMRCLVLADHLRNRASDIHFVCRELKGNLIPLIKSRGYQVAALPAPELGDPEACETDQWLSVSVEKDVIDTQEAVATINRHWLIMDHYGIDLRWQQDMLPLFERMMVIDDLANREHECHLLLDQNYSLNYQEKYQGLLVSCTEQLLGPGYALLRKEYVGRQYQLRDEVRRILIFLGGGDVSDLAEKIIRVLSLPDYRYIELDIVMRREDVHYDSIDHMAGKRGSVRIHHDLPHLANLLEQADLAFGAGGTTTWERLAVGTPSIVAITAENQRAAVESLAASGMLLSLGDMKTVGEADIQMALSLMLSDVDTRKIMSEYGRGLVDGYGADKVIERILELSA